MTNSTRFRRSCYAEQRQVTQAQILSSYTAPIATRSALSGHPPMRAERGSNQTFGRCWVEILTVLGLGGMPEMNWEGAWMS